ncbi:MULTISPECIES: CgeB family protein [Chelativorans]|jgi:spore maturation protein CgeB|uniref:Spore protein YkvP/CgeB glycosyl transferase-like domain-containing protein n=1 Tax=Chelativorans sp. (strain BNC1) TaxID=266779 RepID=Q11EM2_CHESB|nr:MULTISPECIES: glycosyltransferase [Chelativorans]
MKILLYTHSLISDWNHGNAHFLRGVMRELAAQGHTVLALEPEDGWSRTNLLRDQGEAALARFQSDFPELVSLAYGHGFDHEEMLHDADVVIVHEWTEPALVAQIGRARARGGTFTLIFHDTHHRAVSAEPQIAELQLRDYDLVLAFGETLRERYLKAGWGQNVVTWHEAADTRLFRPIAGEEKNGDLIWIGNWGDDERTAEISEFLIKPASRLGLKGRVHGVRYPPEALGALAETGLSFARWIANHDVPVAFARHRVTVHIPRRPYVHALPGIPTIRVFEALACGIPLISAPWNDAEGLFRPGTDFLFANDGEEMAAELRRVLSDPELAASLSAAGLETIRKKHSCAHRVNELFDALMHQGTLRVRKQLARMEAAE